ncbi:U11/U12 small nuclear ribonucleoprotein 25 kDa protein isoform X1 [Poecilia latipinna]|uniref:Small nuclear ribonucleoprotein U11/U12 subunit 25 n=1 Tax=Poecilia latipinna TaxID=48699 RepID=A0A3B3V4A2_9TELE|nr:PREDICTED: U11/U12 small nuclear ribonucleoprotein 25 kDa protein isoform X1 [Poecilia latipinna]XP_014914780.1 PREDICTED: U11/U12 small nuclear ribonucleoprotein 25 kDa protein isoform X1 [Poecilia latipinna]XP_014914781.1 PREDICTED: U11/U12 small nuclear ribonucleoprotein 25 kDa protein isoform X1 [Poecilia latipinna]XP_014914783.1 PREDICTED: U11/U12 small nuclear ribonucleoprotein 25 kDa protein isoform X1 [Poecilia latipinna]
MTSSQNEVETISGKLKDISLKEEQLEDRKKILLVFQELRNRAEFGETEESAATQQEINSIDNKLKELRIKKAELQKNCDNILHAKDVKFKNDIKRESNQQLDDKIFFVEPPPSFPAPAVILDIKSLPTHPTRTQCPECMQFVTTETFTSVSSVTWLVCIMSAMVGCVAGCCLIPFCMDRFKTTTHRCPKCRSKITTIKKL